LATGTKTIMTLRDTLHPTNRRIRILVGLLLTGLFCVQCTQSVAFRESRYMTVVNGKDIGRNAPEIQERLVKLAKTDQVALLEFCLDHVRREIHDYNCTLIKQERINGAVKPEQEIDVAFLDEPFCVAMQWVSNAPVGDRLLYVEGRYDDRMLVRPKSPLLRALVPTALCEPEGERAMENTLRPVTVFGFERGLERLLAVYRKARQRGELRTEFNGFADVKGRKTLVITRYLPNRDEYPAAKTVICIDLEYLVPICIEAYNWNDAADWDHRLTGRYVYCDIKLNVGHTLDEFTPEKQGLQPPG